MSARLSGLTWWCPLLAAPLLMPLPAVAATASSSFAVTATVVGACAITTTGLAFGSYAASQLDGSGTLLVTCTNGTPYVVALDAGTGSGASTAVRKMSGPASQSLDYMLYQDAARTVSWGNSAGVDTWSGSGSGAVQTLPVYGRIPAAQAAGAGSYSDTVTVTVSY